MGPLAGDEWGFTGTFHKDNGGGFLTDHYPQATKACWDFEGVFCCSRHIPGVRFPGLIHPGLIGTAPSQDLLDMWNSREATLVAEEGTAKEKTLCSIMATRPLACLPNPQVGEASALRANAHSPTCYLPRPFVTADLSAADLSTADRGCLPMPQGAMLGELGHFSSMQGDEGWAKVAKEAARTVPGRENGGNCDIKNLSRGCTVYFPVFVDGANLSMGDMHFSQGDGEVSFCGAIEMSGFLELKTEVIKGGMKFLPVVGPSKLNVNPIFEIGPLEPRYSEFLVFEGISVDEQV